MKRLGVRVAGGVGVVLLGILAAAQSQLSQEDTLASEVSELAQSHPAPPIAAGDLPDWDSGDVTFRGQAEATAPTTAPRPDTPAPATSEVQLAAHEEPVAAASAPPAMGMPPVDTPPPEDASSGPATTLQMPQSSEASDPTRGPAFQAAADTTAAMAPPTIGEMNPAADQDAAPAEATGDAEQLPTVDMNMGAPTLTGMGREDATNATDPSSSTPPDAAAPPPVNRLRSGTAAAPADAADPYRNDQSEPQGEPAAASPLNFQPAEMVLTTGPETQPEVASDAGLTTAENANRSAQPAPPAHADQPDAAMQPVTDRVVAGDPPALDVRDEPAQPQWSDNQSGQSSTPQPAPLMQTNASTSANPIASAPQAAPPTNRMAALGTASVGILEKVSGEPGDRRWEGAQAPSVLIHKRAPEEVRVGQPATFVIDVRNVGTTDAFNVQVHDHIPAGMQLVDAVPRPEVRGDALTWSLGGLEPGGERTITMQLVPEAEGELGSVARVTFEAAASVRTIATRPRLKMTANAPEQVLIGQQIEMEIEVKNTGTGTATGVFLQANLPEGLEHPKGRELDNMINDLAPGETWRQLLRMRAVAPGPAETVVQLVSDDGATEPQSHRVDITSPQLAVELQGPSKKFLERQARFNLAIANVGTANATNVEIVAYLDRGFTFVSTENQGQYNPTTHAVTWSLAELPAGQEGTVPLTVLPVEEGAQSVRLEATGDLGLRQQSEKEITVATLAELAFTVSDDQDPVEIGSDTTYTIRVTNNGTRSDSNVQLQVQLPAELQLVSTDRDAGTDGAGLVVFEPLAAVQAEQEEVYRLRVRGAEAGTHKIRVQLTSDQSAVPVIKEESTTTYSDQ